MNTPNKLTLLRVLLVPVFVLLFYLTFKGHYFASAAVFVAASVTDAIDGHLARKNGQVTDFGKFLDPLADKVLVISALACLLEEQRMSIVVFLLIMTREFTVSALRLVAAGQGTVVPAGFAGKLKTAFTMAALIAEMVWLSFIYDFDMFGLNISESIIYGAETFLAAMFWIAAGLTVWSGGQYLAHYWKYINPNK